jgi:hypothetical protein
LLGRTVLLLALLFGDVMSPDGGFKQRAQHTPKAISKLHPSA